MKSALAQLVEPFMPTEGVPKRKEYLNSYPKLLYKVEQRIRIVQGILIRQGQLLRGSLRVALHPQTWILAQYRRM